MTTLLIGSGCVILLTAFLSFVSASKPPRKPTSVVRRVRKTTKSRKPRSTPRKQNATKATTTKIVFDGNNPDKATHVQLDGKLVILPAGPKNKETRRQLRDQAARQFEGKQTRKPKATRAAKKPTEQTVAYKVISIDSINGTFVVA